MTANGTAHLQSCDLGTAEPSDDMSTVEQLLSQNADLGTVRLFKSDTDGLDFSILQWALSSLAVAKPVLFFEFDPLIGDSSAVGALQAVEGLIQIGYRRVVVYDNFGNFVLGTELSSMLARDLVTTAIQRQRAGGGAYYFDLCCFAAADADLFEALALSERVVVAFE